MTEERREETGRPGRMRWLIWLPPALFLALGSAFWFGLTRDAPDELPSALAGRVAPSLDALPALPGAGVPAPGGLAAQAPYLVNFWASWCGPCRAEHPILEAAAGKGVRIVGVNYKDGGENALNFLRDLGNPYVAVGVDDSGRTGLDWGLYGVPETFVIGADGTVLLRHPGPISPGIWESRFAPLMGVSLE